MMLRNPTDTRRDRLERRPACDTLVLRVPRHVPMKVQHRVRRVLRHLASHARVDHARERHVRQLRIFQQRIDAGAERQDRAEVRELREPALRRLPHECVVHVGGVPDVRVDAELEVGDSGRDRGAPGADDGGPGTRQLARGGRP